MPTTLPAALTSAHGRTASAGGSSPVAHRTSARDLHRVAPCCDFTLMGSPTRWDVFQTAAGPEILPALRALSHQPGVGGVLQKRDTETGARYGDPSRAIEAAKQRGWVVVPRSMQVRAFGQDFAGYVHTYPGSKGQIHLTRWERLSKIGADSVSERDAGGYHAFLRRVRDEIVGEPHPSIRRGLKLRLLAMCDRRARRGHTDPGAKRDAEQIGAKLLAFEAA